MWGAWVGNLATAPRGRTVRRLDEVVYPMMGVDRRRGGSCPMGPGGDPHGPPPRGPRGALARAGVGAGRRARPCDPPGTSPDPVALARPITDLVALFSGLRARGRPGRGRTSDDRKPTERTLDHLGVGEFVEALACADDGRPAKPAPDAVLWICDRLGVPPSANGGGRRRPRGPGDGPGGGCRSGHRRPDRRGRMAASRRRRRSSWSPSPTCWTALRHPSPTPGRRLIATAAQVSPPIGRTDPYSLPIAEYGPPPLRLPRRVVRRHHVAARTARRSSQDPRMPLPASTPTPTDLLTLEEAANLARVHRDTVRAWCASGRLPSSSAGRRRPGALADPTWSRSLPSGRHSSQASGADGSPPGPRGTSSSNEGSGGGDALRRLASELSGSDTSTPCLPRSSTTRSACSAPTGPACGSGTRSASDRSSSSRHATCPLMSSRSSGDSTHRPTRPGCGRSEAARARLSRPGDRRRCSRAARALRHEGIASACFVPVVFRGDSRWPARPLSQPAHDWTPEEVDLATRLRRHHRHRDRQCPAHGLRRGPRRPGSARSRTSPRASSSIQDVRGIGEADRRRGRSLITYDTLRVYERGPRDRHGASRSRSRACSWAGRPGPGQLRVPLGGGLTGWVAAHNEPLVSAMRTRTAAASSSARPTGPESMLLVPMFSRASSTASSSSRGSAVDRFRPDDLDDPQHLRRRRRPGDRQRRAPCAARAPAGGARPPAGQPAAAHGRQRAAALDPRPEGRPRADRRLAEVRRGVRLADHLPDRRRARRATPGHRPRPLRRADPRLRRAARHRAHRLGGRQPRIGPGQRRPYRPAFGPDPGYAIGTGIDDHRAADGRGRGAGHAQHRADGRRVRVALHPRTSSS